MRLSATQLSALLEGLDWRRVHQSRRTRVPVVVTWGTVTQGVRAHAGLLLGRGR